jgi:hypothetical protein
MAACRWQLQFEDLARIADCSNQVRKARCARAASGSLAIGSSCALNGCYPVAGSAWRAPRPSSRALRAAAVGKLGAVKLKDRTARQAQKAVGPCSRPASSAGSPRR